jgi:hypothetical protein
MKNFFTHKRVALTFLLIAVFVVTQVARAQMTSGIQTTAIQQQTVTGLQQGTTVGIQLGTTGGTTGIGTTGPAPTGSVPLTGGPQMAPCQPTEFNVHGWIWSSDIGWTALNCADAGGNTHFGVNQDSNGAWTGWAWSENLGWLKFGGGIGAPAQGYLKAAGATDFEVQKVTGTATADRLVGYARFCTLSAGPTQCAGLGANTGGADGYVSMNGFNDQNSALAGVQTTTNYGVTIAKVATSGQYPITGYAWGGEDIGWMHFEDAYVDSTPPPTQVSIGIKADPSVVNALGDATALTYYIRDPQGRAPGDTGYDSINQQYFDGTACASLSTPTLGTGWPSTNMPGLSAAHPTRTVTGITVPLDPTNYQIQCPVIGIPTQNIAASATAVTLHQRSAPTLTAQSHDLCVSGSVNSAQSTTLSWVVPPAAFSYCKLYSDGVAGAQIPAATGSATVGPFSSSTSNPYNTPSTPGSPHEYYLRCYDASNNQLAESSHEYVGVAPATFNGTTANGALNCGVSPWGIIMTAQNTIISSCSAASLSWQPTGTVPAQYTYAKLKVTSGGITTTLPTAYGLSGSASITSPGDYSVYYYTTGATQSTISGGPITVTQNVGSTCHTFSGPSNFGPLCPAGSVNTQNAVPKSFPWSASSGATCTISTNGGQQIPTTGTSGSISVSAPKTVVLSCNWPDGTFNSSSASYGPMLTANSAFCSTPPPVTGVPIIKER